MELNKKSDASGAASKITTVQSVMNGEDGKQVGEAAQPPKFRVGPKRRQVPYGCRGPRLAKKKKKEQGPSSGEGKPSKNEAGSIAASEAQPTEEKKPNADNADGGNGAETGGNGRRGGRRLPPPAKSLRIRAINHPDFF